MKPAPFNTWHLQQSKKRLTAREQEDAKILAAAEPCAGDEFSPGTTVSSHRLESHR
jgi:hypothetical protein